MSQKQAYSVILSTDCIEIVFFKCIQLQYAIFEVKNDKHWKTIYIPSLKLGPKNKIKASAGIKLSSDVTASLEKGINN